MDYLIKGAARGAKVRVIAVESSEIAAVSAGIHKPAREASALFSRVLTAAAMFGSMLKSPQSASVIIRGDYGEILATSDSTANVRGYISNKDISKINGGNLTVIKDSGLKKPYFGKVKILSNDVAECVGYYFSQSEQIPTAVALGAVFEGGRITRAGGYLIQLTPGAPKSLAEELERAVSAAPPIDEALASGAPVEDILKNIVDFEPLETLDIEYRCPCRRESITKVLRSIGKKELQTILEEDREAIVHCHFCEKDYYFSENELVDLINGG